jgi:hypothetical protein
MAVIDEGQSPASLQKGKVDSNDVRRLFFHAYLFSHSENAGSRTKAFLCRMGNIAQ